MARRPTTDRDRENRRCRSSTTAARADRGSAPRSCAARSSRPPPLPAPPMENRDRGHGPAWPGPQSRAGARGGIEWSRYQSYVLRNDGGRAFQASRRRSAESLALQRTRPLPPYLLDRRREIPDERIDLGLVRAETEHADAAEEPAVRRAAGHHHTATLRGLLHQCTRRRVFIGERRAGPGEVEGEQRQLRRRVDHDAGQRRDA